MGHALIFDSGVGGLSVAAEIRKRLPGLRMTYAADDVFRPYGAKTEAQLKARLPRLLWELTETAQPDLVVIACNTASTTALSEIRAAIDVPVIGVVPAIKPAAAASRTKTIAVLGTPGTVKRRYVDDLIHDFAEDCHVILQGSVNLVDIAEKKLAGESVNLAWIKTEIAPLFNGKHGADIDAVVLACTHFPLLRDELKASVTQSVQWIDSGDAIARRVETVLKKLTPKPFEDRPDTALLVGPKTSDARIQTFNNFGFKRVVSLMP
ncbi:glutamate racemase [Hellea balneolensis]|uniref:glutamate racemase n=1 Tax=Hellea balneolensis TaxID=287478 RepID=UPI0003F7162D|nr:glutamate racemase [Hellea balneolensis]